jgi:hypothetical protein
LQENKVVRSVTTFHSHAADGKLPESQGRELSAIIDNAMFATVDLGLYQIQGMRFGSQPTMDDIMRLRSAGTQDA